MAAVATIAASPVDAARAHAPTVAMLPFSYVYDDFLDKINVSIESFSTEMSGGWLFGYVEALKRVGVRTIVICFSARVSQPTSFTNKPTGITVWVLPSPRIYRALVRRIANPYGRNVQQAFGGVHGARRIVYPLLWLLKESAPYFATPLGPLANVIRRERCDAILCQEYEYAIFDKCAWLGQRLQLPVFASFQGGDYQRGQWERIIRPRTIRSAAGLIIATRKETERVRARYKVDATKLARIFNPLDLTKWKPVDRASARTILGIPLTAQVAAWHGRVTIQQKGLDVLLAAWEQVRREREDRDRRLLLVGTGRDAGLLRQRIASLQLPGIHWIDEYVLDRDVIRRHLCAADVYVLPSRHEGFPVAPIEAMACGLPVVAADANGVTDIFAEGESSGGIIVPRDDPPGLARALIRLFEDEPLRRRMGAQARQNVEAHFSLEAVGQQLRNFLCAHGLPSASSS